MLIADAGAGSPLDRTPARGREVSALGDPPSAETIAKVVPHTAFCNDKTKIDSHQVSMSPGLHIRLLQMLLCLARQSKRRHRASLQRGNPSSTDRHW